MQAIRAIRSKLSWPLSLSLLALCATSFARHDLEADLRRRVDALKEEARTEQTTNGNVREWARIVFDWGNAVAMAGEHIPINLTLRVRTIITAGPNRTFNEGLLADFDRYIHELSLRDDDANALGSLTIEAPEASPARSWQTIAVTYTVGSLGMKEGGRILLARQFMSNGGALQRTDPAGDNFLSIRCSNPSASFKADTNPWSGPHGGFRAPAPMPSYVLEGTDLAPGETITLTLGDTSGGGRGFEIQSFSTDAVPVPVYVDVDNSGQLCSLAMPSYAVSGAEAYGVNIFAPSIVQTGERFIVLVRTEDFDFNRAIGAIPEYEVTLNGRAYTTIPARSNAIHHLLTSFESPGIYRFGARSVDGRIAGHGNPIWVQDDPEYRIYWGETHGHSGFAEGQGSADGYFKFGRDDAFLDFLTLSEHDIWMDDYEWKVINDTARQYTVEGDFIVYPGYEWSARRGQGGHHNVFFRRPGHERVSTHRAPVLSELYHQLYQEVDPEEVLIIPHAHQAGDWRQSDGEMERLVEILSQHGTFEWFGRRYLDQGFRVGFVGASDNHVGHPGYSPGGSGRGGRRSNLNQFGGLAAVIAPAKTIDGIFDALRARRAYATSYSERIILDASLNGALMGSQVPFSRSVELKGRVIGTGAIDSIDVIKNGAVVESNSYASGEIGATTYVELGFESDSQTLIRDNPRGFRDWRGTIEVSGADIVSFSFPRHLNRSVDFAQRDPDDARGIRFRIATRGLLSALTLQLDGATRETKIAVHLEESREGGRAPAVVRPNATFPEAEVVFALGDAADGEAIRTFRTGRYEDHLRLRIVNPDAAMEQSFEYRESEGVEPGDYYYFRVRQLDGAMAWSSPFWVGGEAPR